MDFRWRSWSVALVLWTIVSGCSTVGGWLGQGASQKAPAALSRLRNDSDFRQLAKAKGRISTVDFCVVSSTDSDRPYFVNGLLHGDPFTFINRYVRNYEAISPARLRAFASDFSQSELRCGQLQLNAATKDNPTQSDIWTFLVWSNLFPAADEISKLHSVLSKTTSLGSLPLAYQARSRQEFEAISRQLMARNIVTVNATGEAANTSNLTADGAAVSPASPAPIDSISRTPMTPADIAAIGNAREQLGLAVAVIMQTERELQTINPLQREPIVAIPYGFFVKHLNQPLDPKACFSSDHTCRMVFGNQCQLPAGLCTKAAQGKSSTTLGAAIAAVQESGLKNRTQNAPNPDGLTKEVASFFANQMIRNNPIASEDLSAIQRKVATTFGGLDGMEIQPFVTAHTSAAPIPTWLPSTESCLVSSNSRETCRPRGGWEQSLRMINQTKRIAEADNSLRATAEDVARTNAGTSLDAAVTWAWSTTDPDSLTATESAVKAVFSPVAEPKSVLLRSSTLAVHATGIASVRTRNADGVLEIQVTAQTGEFPPEHLRNAEFVPEVTWYTVTPTLAFRGMRRTSLSNRNFPKSVVLSDRHLRALAKAVGIAHTKALPALGITPTARTLFRFSADRAGGIRLTNVAQL